MKKAITEIRGESSTELHARLNDLRKEQFDLKFRASAETAAKTTRHREVRKTIARIMMVLGERSRGQAQPLAKTTKGDKK